MTLEKEIITLVKSLKEHNKKNKDLLNESYLYDNGFILARKYNTSLVNVYSLINYYKVKPDENLGDC